MPTNEEFASNLELPLDLGDENVPDSYMQSVDDEGNISEEYSPTSPIQDDNSSFQSKMRYGTIETQGDANVT